MSAGQVPKGEGIGITADCQFVTIYTVKHSVFV